MSIHIVSDGWTNGTPLINIFGVSASGVVFLSAHDYYVTRLVLILQNPYLKPFKRLGCTMSFKSSLISYNASNCKTQSLRKCTLTHFGQGVWFTH